MVTVAEGTALVTGGDRGIGRALAEEIAMPGHPRAEAEGDEL